MTRTPVKARTVEQKLDPEDGVEYPLLIDGARHAPPEDCGGPPGLEAFLEAMRDEAHEAHEAMMEWYGERFDPEDLELEAIEAMLVHRLRGKVQAVG